ncbi:WXG100 family type VII secretion target [Amycolatopsis sp. cg5]|uniref:WXG100 family type VII secretion target n=1 Tax=Amycolatopsis sp. cg5 TaxID=3238802 RepID=UPI003525A424
MTENFYLDPAEVAQATGRIKAANDDLSSAFEVLESVLLEHDGCWGHDDVGKTFEQKYVKPATEARTAIGNSIENTGGTASNLEQASSEFQGLDQESAARLDAVVGEEYDQE